MAGSGASHIALQLHLSSPTLSPHRPKRVCLRSPVGIPNRRQVLGTKRSVGSKSNLMKNGTNRSYFQCLMLRLSCLVALTATTASSSTADEEEFPKVNKRRFPIPIIRHVTKAKRFTYPQYEWMLIFIHHIILPDVVTNLSHTVCIP